MYGNSAGYVIVRVHLSVSSGLSIIQTDITQPWKR